MKLHLSRLILDPFSRRVHSEIQRPYEMHRTLSTAFPGLSAEEFQAARVLFRLDEENGRVLLLVQSQVAPDWAAFRHKLGDARYLLAAPVEKSFNAQFTSGQFLRYRLVANPTFRAKGSAGKDGKRTGLFTFAERQEWLLRQSTKHGFEVPEETMVLRPGEDSQGKTRPVWHRGTPHTEPLTLRVAVSTLVDLNSGAEPRDKVPKGGPPPQSSGRFKLKGHHRQFSAAQFDGTLKVTDPELLAQAVAGGIGSAKGFGFGLLSLAPASK